MPQLMPLNWMVSSILILTIVISGCVVYSENMFIKKIVEKDFNVSLTKMNWCW